MSKPKFHYLATSRLDTTRHVRRVEPLHFGLSNRTALLDALDTSNMSCRI